MCWSHACPAPPPAQTTRPPLLLARGADAWRVTEDPVELRYATPPSPMDQRRKRRWPRGAALAAALLVAGMVPSPNRTRIVGRRARVPPAIAGMRSFMPMAAAAAATTATTVAMATPVPAHHHLNGTLFFWEAAHGPIVKPVQTRLPWNLEPNPEALTGLLGSVEHTQEATCAAAAATTEVVGVVSPAVGRWNETHFLSAFRVLTRRSKPDTQEQLGARPTLGSESQRQPPLVREAPAATAHVGGVGANQGDWWRKEWWRHPCLEGRNFGCSSELWVQWLSNDLKPIPGHRAAERLQVLPAGPDSATGDAWVPAGGPEDPRLLLVRRRPLPQAPQLRVLSNDTLCASALRDVTDAADGSPTVDSAVV